MYFYKSDKRKLEFKEKRGYSDQKHMLKHVYARWLSIRKCLDRLLLNWDALKAYFMEQASKVEKSSKAIILITL